MTARVCIVGAGPAGLAQARALLWAGIPFDVIERHRDVGGMWDLENPGTPMYASCELISSKALSGFLDYPMPRAYPDYPSRAQVLDYLRAFAGAYDLHEHISLGREVEWAEPEGDGWRVRLDGGETRRYGALICASGMSRTTNMPEIPGAFSGEIRHAATYKETAELAGCRVLVVGGGNSGCDIACDAAEHAVAAFLSLRRGYHVIPKHVFGMPADVFGARTPPLPTALRLALFERLLVLAGGGRRGTGLPEPDHRILEAHPIINSDLLPALRSGRLQAKPDLREFDGSYAVFADGSREAIDLVLLATGYEMRIPFMDPAHFDWRGGKLDAYLSVFNRRHETLFSLGFLVTNAGVFEDFDRLARVVASYLRDRTKTPERAARFRARVAEDRPDLTGGLRFIDSPRHATYAEHDAFRRAVERTRAALGWPDPRSGPLTLKQL